MSSSATPQFLSLCPVCQHQIDVTRDEPFAKRACPECGQLVRVRRNFDHFRLVRQIGEGGMSRVFEAEDEKLGRRVALKILNRTFSQDETRVEQFKREALITARLNHLNVIKLFTTGEDHGYFFIAMELVGGGSLEHRIKTLGRLPEEQVLHIGREVAEGLRAGWKDGLIHRDVKPANILFTDTGTAKVVDFGLALFAGSEDKSAEIWATPYYVAPEKVLKHEEDYRSDIFSLGATLYHALTGRPPHKVDGHSMSELQRVKEKPVRLEDTGLRFSSGTVSLVNRMLELDPAKRPPDYDAVVDELRVAEQLVQRRFGWVSRQRVAFWLGTAATVVAAFVIGWMARSAGEKQAHEISAVSRAEVEALAASATTLTGGQTSVADRFREARNQIAQGSYAEARGVFDALIKEGLRQPTLNWARFHAAVCAAAQGDTRAAQRYLQQMARDETGRVDLTGGESDFFIRLGTDFTGKKSAWPGLEDLKFDRSTEEVLGYLLAGLMQWHFGDATQGAAMLEAVEDAMPTLRASSGFAQGSLDWVPDYVQGVAGRYRQDIDAARTVASLPESPQGQLEIQATLAQLEGINEQLKTGGQLRSVVNRRMETLRRELARDQMKNQAAHRDAAVAQRKRELSQLDDLATLLPSLTLGYDYGKAVEILSDLRFETPEVAAALESKLYLYREARRFIDGLERDVSLAPWSGTLTLTDGSHLQGRVVRLSATETELERERGRVVLPTASIAPESLVDMARAYVERITDSTDYYERMERMAVFARVAGLATVSSMIAAPLMEENRGFRMRWLRVL
ncbi:MAG: serine/threonine protein kinase [Verrucomicrobiales bacterium]|nr:serine/threonine protein kinase [Verrucomicrobiales bacterium]